MRKILFIILLFSLNILNLYALELDTNFKKSCYEKISVLKNVQDNIVILNTYEKDFIPIGGNKLLNYKYYKSIKDKYINYKIVYISSSNKDFKYINDGNLETSYSFDEFVDKKREILIDFEKNLVKNTFYYNFYYKSFYGKVRYFLSKDNSTFIEVSERNIQDFDFRYLKIVFENNKYNNLIQKLLINEIQFFEKSKIMYVLNTLGEKNIEIYSQNNCSIIKDFLKYLDKYFIENKKTSFSINVYTKKIDLQFINNPFYNNDFDGDNIKNDIDNCKNIYNIDQKDTDGDLVGDACDFDNFSKNPLEIDTDKDGIGDYYDNCKYVYNPKQIDSNADGYGDLCSDDDQDGIYGKYDNCINIPNSDQKDVNVNGIGDACEFDKDKDDIFDSVDNCITKSNNDQLDDDQDGIGNVCDNCKFYNPSQRDKNNNGIGDICEEIKEKIVKNDKDSDGIINSKDNCKNIYNPDQLDSDNDGVGDVCDNCKSIQNYKQIDMNKNNIGDMCEDSDKDNVLGYLDNCINIPNSDQKDKDNNGVGDVCEDKDNDKILFNIDNCPYDYNPGQGDIDGDKIGDVCDKTDNRFVESNKSFTIGFMVFVALIFVIGIIFMVNKLNKE